MSEDKQPKDESALPNVGNGPLEPMDSDAPTAIADVKNIQDLAKRALSLSEEDESERVARLEEEKLAARREEARKAKKKGALENAASKKLSEIGTKPKKKRVVEEEAPKAKETKPYTDPLIEQTAKISAWAGKNKATVGYLIAGAAIAVAGTFAFFRYQEKREIDASTTLSMAVLDEHGRIGDPEKAETDENQPKDPRPVFKTVQDRRESALGKYRDVQSKYPKTGAAILAKLAEGSLLLDKHQPAEAIAAFEEVKASPLAKVDNEVRGRAIEGIGFAHEQKGESKEALQSFKELENTVEVGGFKELAMYHQARMHEALGEKDKAKELLLSCRERVNKPGDSNSFTYLKTSVDDRLRAIDPNALPAEQNMGGMGPGGSPKMSPAQMKAFQEQIKKMQEQAGKHK